MTRWERRNVVLLSVFGPVLVLTGLAGFVVPPGLSLMSGAPAYNILHIAFGILGTILALSGTPRSAAGFNLGFGLIDLYQAAASAVGLFPSTLFAYRRMDDILHVVLGLVLIVVGMYGLPRRARGGAA